MLSVSLSIWFKFRGECTTVYVWRSEDNVQGSVTWDLSCLVTDAFIQTPVLDLKEGLGGACMASFPQVSSDVTCFTS